MAAPLSPIIESRMLALLAGGATQEDVARALGISRSTVERYAADEDNRLVIAEGRAALRRAIVEKLAKPDGALLRLVKRLEDNADTMLPRDVDALSRAIHNLERVAGSAAGERKGDAAGPRKVVLNVTVPEWAMRRGEGGAVGAPHPALGGGEIIEAEATPTPKKMDGAPTLRGESSGEQHDVRASGPTAESTAGLDEDSDVSGTSDFDAKAAASHPPTPGSRGLADTDVPIPDDFQV